MNDREVAVTAPEPRTLAQMTPREAWEAAWEQAIEAARLVLGEEATARGLEGVRNIARQFLDQAPEDAPVVARDEAAELRAALRTLVADLEALMEESHIELYDGDGNLVGISWGKLLQGGKDEYLSNWRDVKRLAGGEGR